ncbi:MAG: tRNA lysidine(34) synthetase TilS [Prevotella sp.]|nr:tRNA lysidine(34) synthetase TilS [Prevotella sp.]
MMLPEVVRTFIEREKLLRSDGRYLIAVSGGADSVCLLLVLRQLGYHVEAVHCNFMLRGDESHRDEQFVKDLCENLSVKLHLTCFDTDTYAKLHQVSIEMAARQLRYAYFEQLRRDTGADDICVAHHQDDSAETLLLNLLRGTGIHGLQGIQPRRGHIVRPLLCVSRDDIVAWLTQQGQSYVTDSTNLIDDVARNYLRLNILPALRTVNPAVRESLLTTARRVGEATKIYDDAVQRALNSLLHNVMLSDGLSITTVDMAALLQEPSPESLLFEWLHPLGFNAPTIEAVSQRLTRMESGREWTSPTHLLFSHQGQLCVTPLLTERPTLRLPAVGLYVYDTHYRLRIEQIDDAVIERQPDTCCLDASKVAFPLTLRPVRQGDRFQPFGMRGTKLVSDFLTDRHLSAPERRRQLVVTDANERLLWLVGHRPDAHFCIDSHTRQTLRLRFLVNSL